MSKHEPFRLSMTPEGHPLFTFDGLGVLFKYKDAPHEWHVYCVSNGASASGSNLEKALQNLLLLLGHQLDDTLSENVDYFFMHSAPDPEWEEVLRTGKHPDEDIEVLSAIEFKVGFKGKAKVRVPKPDHFGILPLPLRSQSFQTV